MEHHPETDCEFGLDPQGQLEQPPGQFPPQLPADPTPTIGLVSLKGRVPAAATAKVIASRKRLKIIFEVIVFNNKISEYALLRSFVRVRGPRGREPLWGGWVWAHPAFEAKVRSSHKKRLIDGTEITLRSIF